MRNQLTQHLRSISLGSLAQGISALFHSPKSFLTGILFTTIGEILHNISGYNQISDRQNTTLTLNECCSLAYTEFLIPCFISLITPLINGSLGTEINRFLKEDDPYIVLAISSLATAALCGLTASLIRTEREREGWQGIPNNNNVDEEPDNVTPLIRR